MSENNVAFVQKTKEILKEMGVEVKTTQIYELYSKLLNEKNWNQAKAKKKDLTETLKSFSKESSAFDLVEVSKKSIMKNMDLSDYLIDRFKKQAEKGKTSDYLNHRDCRNILAIGMVEEFIKSLFLLEKKGIIVSYSGTMSIADISFHWGYDAKSFQKKPLEEIIPKIRKKFQDIIESRNKD